jgi:hypothetical protein
VAARARSPRGGHLLVPHLAATIDTGVEFPHGRIPPGAVTERDDAQAGRACGLVWTA